MLIGRELMVVDEVLDFRERIEIEGNSQPKVRFEATGT